MTVEEFIEKLERREGVGILIDHEKEEIYLICENPLSDVMFANIENGKLSYAKNELNDEIINALLGEKKEVVWSDCLEDYLNGRFVEVENPKEEIIKEEFRSKDGYEILYICLNKNADDWKYLIIDDGVREVFLYQGDAKKLQKFLNENL